MTIFSDGNAKPLTGSLSTSSKLIGKISTDATMSGVISTTKVTETYKDTYTVIPSATIDQTLYTKKQDL